MTPSIEMFAATFASARAKLLEAATAAGCRCTPYIEPGVGAEGEVLAMDVVRAGSEHPSRVLIVTSACHGVEGHAGSAVQIGLLRDAALLRHLNARGVSLLLIHALNPHGFSFASRTTCENIDLNRNVVDFQRQLPRNDGYRELHHLLVPESWPPSPQSEGALGAIIAQRGLRAFQETVTRGQHEFSDGLFFGGFAPAWGHRVLRAVLQTQTPMVRTAAWIDIHTGLGPCGVAEKIFTGGGTRGARALADQWWCDIRQTEDGSASSTALVGTLAGLMIDELGPRLAASITLEFGTASPMQVLAALRLDAWARRAGPAAGRWRDAAAQAMREAFYVDTPAWKAAVAEQGMASVVAAIEGVAMI